MDRLTAISFRILEPTVMSPAKRPVESFEARLHAAPLPPQAPVKIEPPHDVTPPDPLSAVRGLLRRVETDFALGEAALNKVLEAAKKGVELKPGELLGLQAQMQRYDMEFQLLFKMVELLVNALKELIKLQV